MQNQYTVNLHDIQYLGCEYKKSGIQMVKRNRHHPSRKDDGALSFQVTPKNKPDFIDYHLMSLDGKNWVNQPGIPKLIIHGVRTEDIDTEITNLITPLSEFSREIKNTQLFNKLIDCNHKLYAVKYHLQTIKAEINERVKEFEDNYNPGAGAEFEIENPRLIYETEAFLFQVKSSLDVLIQTLGCVIPPLNLTATLRARLLMK